MHKHISCVSLSLALVLCFLTGCSGHRPDSSVKPAVSVSHSSEFSLETSEATDCPAVTSSETAFDNSVIEPIGTTGTTDSESKQLSETLPQEDGRSKETFGVTEPDHKQNSSVQYADITAISATLQNYTSSNEEPPYPKGEPIYKILYNGNRAQVGDVLTFDLSVTPAENSGRINIDATDNLTYILSGTTLTITVNSAGEFDMGRVMLYGMSSNGKTINSKCSVSFVVDKAENPYNHLSTVFSEYIRKCGMQFETVSSGYTVSDTSLSITHYAHAPAWDDMIDRNRQDYLSKCFWLIDEYAMRGFHKANFIITETEIGFSAST